MAERILIVDDSPTQLEALRSLLSDNGYEITVAHSAAEALRAVAATPHDLVLSDIVMPGMSGYELCSRIKQDVSQAPPVVLLTSLSDPRDIVRGVECGADNYVTKPYEHAHLLDRIRHVLDNARLRGLTPPGGPVRVNFQGETYELASNPQQIVDLMLSSFEELIRTNNALQSSKRQLAQAHNRELRHEQDARALAEESARHMETLVQKAEAAMRVRDDVLATVSHDLRNPLGTIYSSASLLVDMQLTPDAQKRQLEIIRRTSKRMDRLIQDLLDVSSIEAGGFAIHRRSENPRLILYELREQHIAAANAKNVDLTEGSPDDIAQVFADRERVLQVMSNLVGNALKFTPAGGSIAVRAENKGDDVVFSVRDTGVGIPPDSLPRVFDRFWFAGAGGGSGLGLAIAKGIIEAHDGRIWVESSEAGTTFFFTLPTATAASKASVVSTAVS